MKSIFFVEPDRSLQGFGGAQGHDIAPQLAQIRLRLIQQALRHSGSLPCGPYGHTPDVSMAMLCHFVRYGSDYDARLVDRDQHGHLPEALAKRSLSQYRIRKPGGRITDAVGRKGHG
jgi:hypothetical protein